MIYSGKQVVEFLSAKENQEESKASSHWLYYHRDFEILEDGSIIGIKGFGGCQPPYRGLKSVAHRLLQHKFRRIARNYKSFEDLDEMARLIAEKQDRAYDHHMLRQAQTLAFVLDYLPPEAFSSAVAVIGDGFASLASLLLASENAQDVIIVNLNKTLLVDVLYAQSWLGEQAINKIKLVVDEGGVRQVLADKEKGRIIAIQASNHHLLRFFPLSLVFNIVSMQEMDPPVIAEYFADMRAVACDRDLYFYCCNREEKELPDGTVTRFFEYPWKKEDTVIVDELCPWHQKYYTRLPPFYHSYDGLVRHRLVKMS